MPSQIDKKPKGLPYRVEIDSLRAIAVIPVVLYHAGLESFSGGYVGVDVFFVISGYLITQTLIADLQSGSFSLRSFYARRARRILPALFVMILFSIPFAWLWLPASDMQDYSQSVVAATGFASNVLFWLESGYFDANSSLKPLLHTWSLGVEEQFYLVFPLLLLLTWRIRNGRTFAVILGLAMLSLIAAEWTVQTAPVGSFYLLPMRFWELALGSLTAIMLPRGGHITSNRILTEFAGWIGVCLIAFAVLVFDSSTPFPGLAALIPTVGTALIIIYARAETSLGKFLRVKVFVYLGAMSYSIYLYHYPIFSFSKRLLPGGPGLIGTLLLLFLSLFLAFVSWKYIETPWRNRDRNPIRGLTISLAVGVGLVSLGLWGHMSGGFKDVNRGLSVGQAAETLTSQNFIVIGDSHADDLRRGLTKLTTGELLDFTSNGCIPLRNVDRYDSRFTRGVCSEAMNAHLDFLLAEDPQAFIILGSMGPIYLEGTGFVAAEDPRVEGLGVELTTSPGLSDRWAVYEQGLRTTLGELSDLKNGRVVFVIDWPELGIANGCNYEPKSIRLGRHTLRDSTPKPETCYIERDLYEARAGRYKTLVSSVSREFPSIQVFDPTELFCDSRLCRGTDPKGNPWYRDWDHLSDEGSVYVARALITQIDGR